MPVGARRHYYLRGAYLEFYEDSLEQAITALIQKWLSSPSLLSHAPGNLTISLQIGSSSVDVEITDPSVIEEMFSRPETILDELARHMDMPAADAKMILEQASASVRVDTIRDPNNIDAWRPGLDTETLAGAEPPSQAMPGAATTLIGALLKEQDRSIRRDKSRPRTRYGRRLLELAVEAGKNQGLGDTQIAKRIGAPRTTVRDARYRMERVERIQQQFGERKPGQRLTSDQKKIIRQELTRQKGNASATARALGLPAKTVRDLRVREARAAASARKVSGPGTAAASARKTRYTRPQRSALTLKLIEKVKAGASASEAGRLVGVKPRTARSWIRAARLADDG